MPTTFIVTEIGDFLDTENGLDLITEDSTPPPINNFLLNTLIGYPFPDAYTQIGSIT